MAKKLLMSLAAVLVVVAGVAALSAYEAHVINVTAHIENALAVSAEALKFGTVFPQEYLEQDFTINLSQSFLDEDRVYDVEYVIKQKPKCRITPEYRTQYPGAPEYMPVDYATHVCPEGYREMLSLCPFLSKINNDEDGPAGENDVSHPSYFIDPTPAAPNSGDEHCGQPNRYISAVLHYSGTGWGGWSCPINEYAVGGGVHSSQGLSVGDHGIAEPGAVIGGETYPAFPHYTFGTGETGYVLQNGGVRQDIELYVDCMPIVPDASGVLTKLGGDTLDTWTVDLKVPPVKGFVGQDWPAGCPTVAEDSKDYGCDLWIEVTGISELNG